MMIKLQAAFLHFRKILACLLFCICFVQHDNATALIAANSTKYLELKKSQEIPCKNYEFLDENKDCFQEQVLNYTVIFEERNEDFGLIYFIRDGEIDLVQVGTGHVYFFDVLSGSNNLVDGKWKFDLRFSFCIGTRNGNLGYSWNGKAYEINEVASITCPIDQVWFDK